ncbi:MAG TPA: hypothetical protein VFO21_13745 [Vicinamibacterales bacterium]|nr:hypothetical protein [Vicinamibacterales bacterium]
MATKTLPSVARMWPAVALVIAVLSTPAVLAQTPAPAGHKNDLGQSRPGAAAVMRDQGDMADHKQKMAEQAAMMAKMAAADQKLADLVAQMKAAKGEDKVTAVAAVLEELVAQRRHMHQSCGMMKTAPAITETTEADHAAHHPEK